MAPERSSNDYEPSLSQFEALASNCAGFLIPTCFGEAVTGMACIGMINASVPGLPASKGDQMNLR